MHLNIKNDEAHRLATRHLGRDNVADRLMEIGRQYASLPDGEFTDPDDALGYDDNGLPK